MKYALKEMSKCKIINKKSVNSVLNERNMLCNINHLFIVNMIGAFQDRENLYLVMDLLTGGDLRYHIGLHRTFDEEVTKFFVACIIQAQEFLHKNGIIHRDIKPENLVFDELGYLRITDFGIARYIKPENSQDTSGTPGYMAPEVMCRQNHSYAADYYALGVIVYECMFGRRPYVGRSRKEIRDHILSKQVKIKFEQVPRGWSQEAADFCNRLIQRKQCNRLGFTGPAEVKAHPWIRNFNWTNLNERSYNTPFVPNPNSDNFDKKHIMKEDDISDENPLILRRNSIQQLFEGYEYDNSLSIRKELGGQGAWTDEKLTPQHSTTSISNSGLATRISK